MPLNEWLLGTAAFSSHPLFIRFVSLIPSGTSRLGILRTILQRFRNFCEILSLSPRRIFSLRISTEGRRSVAITEENACDSSRANSVGRWTRVQQTRELFSRIFPRFRSAWYTLVRVRALVYLCTCINSESEQLVWGRVKRPDPFVRPCMGE